MAVMETTECIPDDSYDATSYLSFRWQKLYPALGTLLYNDNLLYRIFGHLKWEDRRRATKP